MVEIIPAAYPIPKTLAELEKSAARIVAAVPVMQLDVLDGKFVKNVSWPYGHEKEFARMVRERSVLPHGSELEYEVDLMVAEPEHVIEDWMHLGVRRLIIHLESTQKLENIIKDIAAHVTRATADDIEMVSLGLAINTTTSVERLEAYIHDIDFVQCMGIAEIGKQGEPFDERVLTQIAELRELHPELIISVDGGVRAENIAPLVTAGATRLVSGSGVFAAGDPKKAIKQLQEASKESFH